jgi:lipopolysaccharide transport system ATP-binding protein
MSDPVLSAERLGKRYDLWSRPRPTNLSELGRVVSSSLRRRLHVGGASSRRSIWALRDVSFEVSEGTVVGLIGPNGAGKSTLLSVLARITEPTEGRAVIRGRVSSLLEVGTGFHPELSGRDNIFLNGAVLGMRRRETVSKFDAIVDFAGVGEFIDMPVKRYSTGMYMRLAFAVAAHLDPEVLLIDEVLSVGDQAFQAQCLARIEEIAASGRTVVFVSHDLGSVARLCSRAILIQSGRITFDGKVDTAVERYLGAVSRVHGGGSLADVERGGNGTVRVTHVRIVGGEQPGIVSPDQPTTVELTLGMAAPVDGRLVQVDLQIASTTGTPLVSLSTRFDDDVLADAVLEDGAVISCRIDELPLKPGNYALSLTVGRLGEVWDSVTGQVEFTIAPSEQLGPIPTEHDAPVLARHRWSLGTAEYADPGRT